MISEMLVDWLKHAFITKFNHIRPSVYERYTDVLCRDLASGSAVSRRARKVSLFVRELSMSLKPVYVCSTVMSISRPWWRDGWVSLRCRWPC